MNRKPMPPERQSVTKKLKIGFLKGYITVGLHEDGQPGEVFLHLDKAGTIERGLCHTLAVIVSLALQRGVPLAEIVGKLKGVCFEPAGVTGDPTVPIVNSIVDYVGRYLEGKFLQGETHE